MHPNDRRRRNNTDEKSNLDELDEHVFLLDAEDHERFLAMLDRPTLPSKEMRARANRKPPWDN
jgi:uncharacterized protein (DUF1778 family)